METELEKTPRSVGVQTELPLLAQVAISVGDPNGIGLEVVLKAVLSPRLKPVLNMTSGQVSASAPGGAVRPILFGPIAAIRSQARILGFSGVNFVADKPRNLRSRSANQDTAASGDRERAFPAERRSFGSSETTIHVVDIAGSSGNHPFNTVPGETSANAGEIAMRAVKTATQYCIDGLAVALVTAPISKESIRMAGYNHPGHTEFLVEMCGASSHAMMMVDDGFRLALVTTHVPLAEVATQLSEERILEKCRVLNHSLRHDFGLPDPRIAVLGVNPHAGEAGTLGSEETRIIHPAIKSMIDEGIQAEGPFPADGFFGMRRHLEFDAVLAMYHDQGLIPFKTLAFDTGVNFTAGLSIVRTSPDHGTAFDIAGTNQASSLSMERALALALEVAVNRAASSQ